MDLNEVLDTLPLLDLLGSSINRDIEDDKTILLNRRSAFNDIIVLFGLRKTPVFLMSSLPKIASIKF